MVIKEKDIGDAYDAFPYISYPFSHCRPEYLRTIAKLFDIDAPKLKEARILDIGCSSGGHIIPFAMNYPKSSVLGIDVSQKEIGYGQKEIKDLKLKNITLKHMSLMDINKANGEFDYIVCHCVFAWVPKNMQEKILEICDENLSKNGIAFVSYNVLPYWNMSLSVRELMLYHTASFPTLEEKIHQAKAILLFISDALGEATTPYAKFLKDEIKFLSTQEDHYILHEYLGDLSEPMLFSEFIKQANKHKLAYLADSQVSSMLIDNLPEKARSLLKEVNDVVRTEQYMDFINNRRFRNTILCHSNIKINRELNSNVLDNFYTSMNIYKHDPIVDIKDNSVITFSTNPDNDTSISTSSPIMKAVLLVFAENFGRYFSSKEIIDLTKEKLPSEYEALIEQEFKSNGLRLVFSSYMNILADKPIWIYEITEKPKTSELVLYQVKQHIENKSNKIWVTNQKNEILVLTPFEAYVILYLDGKHTKEQVIEKILEHIKKNDLTLKVGDQNIEDKKTQKQYVTAYCDDTLNLLKQNAILIS